MDKQVEIYRKDINKAIDKFIEMAGAFRRSGTDNIINMALMIADTIKSGNTVYSCGNGGSAADSQHIAGEFIGRFLKDRKPLPFVSLNTDTSVITCVANDFGFDYIFSRQVEALGRSGDILLAFSTSGSSKNIVLAVESAKKIGMRVLSFTGEKGSSLEEKSDLCICSQTTETYLTQQIHQLSYHLICKVVEEILYPGDI